MSDPVFFPLPPKPSVLWAIIIWQSFAVSHLHFLCKSRLRAQSPWAAPGPLWSSPPGSYHGLWSSSCSCSKLTNSFHCSIQHFQTKVQFLCIAHVKLRNRNSEIYVAVLKVTWPIISFSTISSSSNINTFVKWLRCLTKVWCENTEKLKISSQVNSPRDNSIARPFLKYETIHLQFLAHPNELQGN